MHLSSTMMEKMKLPNSHVLKCYPFIAALDKSRHSAFLTPTYKEHATGPGDVVAIDLMMPYCNASRVARNGAVLVLMTIYFCLTATVILQDESVKTIAPHLLQVLLFYNVSPRIINREVTIQSSSSLTTLTQNDVFLKLDYRDHHNELDGVPDQTIQMLRTLALAALLHSQLEDRFWAYAINHAAYVSN